MANSKDDQCHKDKHHDTSRKILSPEMRMCNMKYLLKNNETTVRSYHKEYSWEISKLMHSLFKVNSKVKVFFLKWVKLQGQDHSVKNNGTQGKVLSQGILV